MFNMDMPKESGKAKLDGWRERYSKEEYPSKVVVNLFYELFALEGIWPQIEQIFSSGSKYSDFREAYEQMILVKRTYQMGPLRGLLMESLATDRVAADTKKSNWTNKENLASTGDNESVVEIEYGYWYYNQYCAATLAWAACGLLGQNKEDAFFEVAGGITGGIDFDSFGSVLNGLKNVLGAVFEGFKDASGNEVDPKDIISGKAITYYPKDFPLLPPLW
jgi:hypothetical protein